MERLISILKIGPVFKYFVRVFKKDKNGEFPTSSNLRMMHGINKISIVMFLICVGVLVYRAFFRG
jgi:hypothetical protein